MTEREPDDAQGQCLHRLFEEQVKRTPEAIAAVFEDRTLTYRELDIRANQLAHYLVGRGARPDVPIGVHLERSLELIVAIYGIVKSGACYFPIDPALPSARIAFMLEDAKPPITVTLDTLRQNFPSSAPVVCLESVRTAIERESVEAPDVPVTSGNLAYVIYTSGSTGTPKGVMNTHRGIVNRLLWGRTEFQLASDDSVVQKTPINFDVSVCELFESLLWGARLVLAQPNGHRNPSYLVKLIVEQGVTTVHFVPSMLRVFLSEPGLAQCGSLRRVICSGEVLPLGVQKLFFERLPNVALYNLYGPTEAAVEVTSWACRPNSTLNTVPIGRPVANTQIYILDDHLKPVPDGTVGELHIGGVGVARGYLNRPELTAQKFIPDPFGSDPQARLYKTGDLARFLSDGNIEFVGRLDHQLKIRGVRIELEEIEAMLGAHPLLNGCGLIAREDGRGDMALLACVVPQPGKSVTADSLRRWLRQRIPESMVPSRFVMRDALPLTPSGKLDRKALEEIIPSVGTIDDGSFVAPRNAVEETLVAIWQELFQRPRVGIRDSFFELGGHSLLAVSMVARIRALLAREITLELVFEHPTIESLASEIGSKPAIAEAALVIRPADRSQPLFASFGQKAMWLLRQTLPNPVAYNEPAVYRIRGDVDTLRLQKSLREIVVRHEVLRTALVETENGLCQRILAIDEGVWPWREIDLRSVSAEEKPSHTEKLLRQEIGRPFNLAAAPLGRALWMRLGASESILALTFHHCVVDAWSFRIFFEELQQFYGVNGRESGSPPELPIQFADYAAWQRQRIAGDEAEPLRAYWHEQLKDLPPGLVLPNERPASVQRTGAGKTHRFELTSETVDGIRSLAAQQTTQSLFTLMLSAFQVLLHRYTGCEDLVICTPVADRKQPEVWPLVGYFLNTVPIRVRLNADLSFRSFVQQVATTVLGALSHAELPFEQILEVAGRKAEDNSLPLHKVIFTLLEGDLPEFKLDTALARPMWIDPGTAKTDLILSVNAQGSTWVCQLEFATDLLPEDAVQRLASHFIELLRSIVANPETTIGRLGMIPAEERRMLMERSAGASRKYPRDQCVQQLFEQQVMRTPDKVAVGFSGQALVYEELNARANQLAQHLRRIGVARGNLVALCVERSLDMIVGMLGILKAGGVYVPLEPADPAERLAFMLSDAEVSCLLAQSSLTLTVPAGVRVVWLDRDWPTIARERSDPLPGIGGAEDLAYLMYTSGSTGHPKGVCISHRAIARLVLNTDYIQLEPSDVVAQAANPAFDAATFEIWGALLNGARLEILPSNALLEPRRLAAQLRDLRITTMWATTAWFNLLAAEKPDMFRPLKQLLFGGEAADARAVRAVLQSGGPQQLLNMYGPTETTTFATWHRVEQVSAEAVTIPLGRPIANTEIHLLDQNQQLVPVGLPGEIYIGGDGVANGYWKRPDLTAERFLPHPLIPGCASRLFRTGDLARYRTDGTIEFLTRLDDQVKIRGFRVELGEIEAILRTLPNVRDAVVLRCTDERNEMSLAAYLVPQGATILSTESLREAARKVLPHYMIPTWFEVIKALPLTANGKVDRKGLPAPVPVASGEAPDKCSPRTALETRLLEIWREVFKRPDIGLEDNFFDLGGHSLRAVRLASAIEKLIGHRIPVATIFHWPTIRSLAENVVREDRTPRRSSLVPLQPLGAKPPLYFVHGWGGDVYSYVTLARHLAPDQPIYGLRAVGLEGDENRHTTVEQMAAHYVQQIRSFQPEGAYRLAGYSMGGLIAFEIAQQLLTAGQQVALLALLDTEPFTQVQWSVYLRALGIRLADRSAFHLRAFRSIPVRGRLRFLLQRLDSLQCYLRRNRARSGPIVATPPLTTEPPAVPGYQDYYHAVASAYVFKRYRGSINLFLCEDTPPLSVPCWRALARGGVSLHRLNCNHEQMLRGDAEQALVRVLRSLLDQARMRSMPQH